MLNHLSVNDFVISRNLELEFANGMTVISGETGAGKSIMIDALGLALGDRADANMVRQGAERSDIHASFDISQLPKAQQWLTERELLADTECILRRVVTAEGRSRAYINGKPATINDLKAIGRELIDIHSQHEHQSLLNKEQQRHLLDEFGGNTALAKQLKKQSGHCRELLEELTQRRDKQHEEQAKAQLLHYQIEELESLNLGEHELEALEQEQKQLANGEQTLQASQQALALCSEGEVNINSLIYQALRSLENIDNKTPSLNNATELLSSALIQIEEAGNDIEQHISAVDLNPENLAKVEDRLNTIYEVARKHRVQAKQLYAQFLELKAECSRLQNFDEELIKLEEDYQLALADYELTANKLSKKRLQASKKLNKAVNEQLKLLAMQNCQFETRLVEKNLADLSSKGLEDIHFYVSTNPGQAAGPLAKIASGGELSRISLAIQVVIAQNCHIPTLVFDEVDVGIGGATAETVGILLRQLGEKGQVLCVTHQAQVASKGHQHLFVSKAAKGKSTSTEISILDEKKKIEEVARMLGGIEITQQTLAHAEEMLALH